MEEWIQHYTDEGATHFYLMDDGSDDGTADILAKYDSGLVTVFHPSADDPDDKQVCPNPNTKLSFEPLKQVHFYNSIVLPLARVRSVWLGVLDLDEFAYATATKKSLAAVLDQLDDSIGQTWYVNITNTFLLYLPYLILKI